MRRPNYTDRKPRYWTAAESSQPGYLKRRFKAISRLQRMRARCSVQPIKKEAA